MKPNRPKRLEMDRPEFQKWTVLTAQTGRILDNKMDGPMRRKGRIFAYLYVQLARHIAFLCILDFSLDRAAIFRNHT